MPSVFVTSIIAFFSTTLDDFAVLLIFYAKARQSGGIMPYVHVSLGQIFGFTFVVALSLTGLIIGSFVPQEYVNTIGLIPIILGVKKGYELLSDEGYLDSCYASCGYKKAYLQIPDEEAAEPTPRLGLMSPRANMSIRIQRGEEPHKTCLSKTITQCIASCFDPLTLEVFMYAIVCSSDNIGIYIALFATMTGSQVAIIIAVFYLMLLVSIAVALGLVQVLH